MYLVPPIVNYLAHFNFMLQNQSTTWLCLDGNLSPTWSDNFNTVLSSERVRFSSIFIIMFVVLHA